MYGIAVGVPLGFQIACPRRFGFGGSVLSSHTSTILSISSPRANVTVSFVTTALSGHVTVVVPVPVESGSPAKVQVYAKSTLASAFTTAPWPATTVQSEPTPTSTLRVTSTRTGTA